MIVFIGHCLSEFHGKPNEFELLLAYSDGREIGHCVDKSVAEYIAALDAQNAWLKDRISDLQLPKKDHRNIERWLRECGMPRMNTSLEADQ